MSTTPISQELNVPDVVLYFMKNLITILLFLSLNLASFADTLRGEAAKTQLLSTGSCPSCDLSYVDLSGQDLTGANLSEANLKGANLRNTSLRGANLQGAIMLELDLSETPLSGANMKQADLSDLDIDLVFEYVEIIGTQFEGARFKYGIICGPPPKKGGWGCQHL